MARCSGSAGSLPAAFGLLLLLISVCTTLGVVVPVAVSVAAGQSEDWACQCTKLQDEQHGFALDDFGYVKLVPGLGDLHCKVPEDAQNCKPLAEGELLHPNVRGCTLGDLDVALPAPARYPNMTKLPGQSKEWMDEVMMMYRSHICAPGHYLEKELQVSCDPDVLGLQENKTLRVQGSVLDFGADVTGMQLQYLAQYLHSPVSSLVGFNVKSRGWRPLTQYFDSPSNYSMVWGEEGGCLPFPDASFDFVYSINVLEHAMPYRRYLSEAARVLKPGGLLYIQTYPNWWSARGHHIHIDLVWTWARALEGPGRQPQCVDSEIGYANNGSFIPDWSHLLWGRAQMAAHLNDTTMGRCQPLLEMVLAYMYDDAGPHSSGLNKARLADYEAFLSGRLGMRRTKHRFWAGNVGELTHSTAEKLAERYGHSDFLLAGAEYWFVKPGAAAGPVPAAPDTHSGAGSNHERHEEDPNPAEEGGGDDDGSVELARLQRRFLH